MNSAPSYVPGPEPGTSHTARRGLSLALDRRLGSAGGDAATGTSAAGQDAGQTIQRITR